MHSWNTVTFCGKQKTITCILRQQVNNVFLSGKDNTTSITERLRIRPSKQFSNSPRARLNEHRSILPMRTRNDAHEKVQPKISNDCQTQAIEAKID